MSIMVPARLSTPPSPPLPVPHNFDMWRDYLNLSKVLGAIIEERGRGSGTLLAGEAADLCLPGTPLRLSPGAASSPKPSGWHRSDSSGRPRSGQNRVASPQTPGGLLCNFCRHNGESKRVYSSHSLKHADGTVLCPILRNYVCPVCGATGAGAHTLKYCPLNQEKQSLYCKGGRNSAGCVVRR